MRIQKEKNRCFTLIELIIVLIILAILVSAGIPIYNRAIEDIRGNACQNNMRTIFAAWRIYNMREATDWDPGGSFQNISQINTNLGTLLDERYFGQQFSTSITGFYMDLFAAINCQHLHTYRLRPSIYQDDSIACNYYYNNGTYNWDSGTGIYDTTWPLPLTE